VRELRENAAEVLRQVREGAEYVVTYQGRPVAVLLPVDTVAAEAASCRPASAARRAIGAPIVVWPAHCGDWPAERASADVLDEIRRG
jgi:prevent-host-death family protein